MSFTTFAHPRSLAVSTALAGALAGGTALGSESDLYEHGGEAGCRHGKLELTQRADAYDSTTGRNLRNFPRDRRVDFVHMKLEMRFEDLETPRFTARETLTITPIGTPTDLLELDAVGLGFQSVTLDGASVEHYVEDESIAVTFDPPLAVGAEHELVFEYECVEPYDGLFFTPSSATVPSYTAEVHTQGQTITNRHWFVAHDSPDERMSTELIVDVPAGYAVSSNGELVRHEEEGTRAVWHWLQAEPHVSYLVTLVIGKFDIVPIPHDRVPMQVWVPVGKGDQVMQTYGRTGAMIDLFERRFGVPYPWARYDQLVVKNFGAGGMENTSATTMYPTAILDETSLLDADLDSLIAHELAHQWSGDLLTCKEWAHIWLNEGFATYGSALWFEEHDGTEGYLDSMRRNFRVARRDRTTDDVGMVSPVYEHPGDTFRRRANPYPKGASILHMLRKMLGEEVFWTGMHRYMNRHAFGTVETHDLRYAMEEVSGRGLEWFFDQWCHRPGSPNLDVDVAYDPRSRDVVVKVEQTQTIDERTPAFRFTLPVRVTTANGVTERAFEVTEQSSTFTMGVDGAPTMVEIDPELCVLSVLDVTKSERLWMEQATSGTTIVTRHRAIGEVGAVDTPERRAALADLAADEDLHRSLRQAALAGLRRMGSDEAKQIVLDLLDDGIDDARVRVDAVEFLDEYDLETVSERLAHYASEDESYAVRAAALRAIGNLEAVDLADLVVEMVDFESQHSQVRRAALSALADLDDARGLDLALKYAQYGYMDRARPTAISVVGTLAEHDEDDRVVPFLIGLLDDPGSRPAGAAGGALVDLGDERALDPIRAMAEAHPDPDRRRRAERWLEELEGNIESDEGNDS